MKLARIDVNGPDVFTNQCDLRRDLHVFVDYVANRDVKRSTRGNNLPKVDARRLAKLITDPNAVEQVEANARGTWLGYIDWLALKLGFVNYDTKGRYLGYSSREPSYPDNYIEYQEKKYNRFMALSLRDQEQLILNTLIEHYSYSEERGTLVLKHFNRSEISSYTVLYSILGPCQDNHAWIRLEPFTM